MNDVRVELKGVTVLAKANVFFDGKVVSHTVLTADNTRKSVGIIFPGKFHFGTDKAERMEITAGECEVKLDGKSEVTVTPLESTRYTITANNAAGGQSRTVEVSVLGHLSPALPAPATVCTFEASRTVVRPGEQVDLHWLCQGNAKVRLEPGGLELDGQAGIAVVPDKTTVYTLSVSNLLGGTSRSVEVRVEAPRRVLTEKDLVDPEEAVKPLDRMDLAEALHRGEAMREAAPAGSWTLRLVVSGRDSGLRQVARAAGPRAGEILVLPFPRKDGVRFWQACFGTYPSRTLAVKAWTRAPEALRRTFRDALAERLPVPTTSPAGTALVTRE